MFTGEYDIRFHESLSLPQRNRESVGELLLGFFHFYFSVFDKEKSVVSVRLGQVLQKTEVWTNPRWWRISIEDPFERSDHDLGRVVTHLGQRRITTELKRAVKVLGGD